MKWFLKCGLLLQAIFAFVSIVYGVADEEVQYKEANAELSKEATRNTIAILNAHNSTSFMKLNDLVYGVESLLIFLNNYAQFKHDSVEYLKQETINIINKVKREMQSCLDGYSGVLQSIIDKVSTREKPIVKTYLRHANDLEEFKRLLISTKSHYLDKCAPEARNAALEHLKKIIFRLLESKALNSVIAAGKQKVVTSENIHKQIMGILNELDDDAAKSKSAIKSFLQPLYYYKPHVDLKFQKQASYILAEDLKKTIDECNEEAKGTFNINLDEHLLRRSSITRFCAEIPSPKCRVIMQIVDENILSPSLNLIKIMLDEKKSEVKALMQICVNSALLDKIQDIRFSK